MVIARIESFILGDTLEDALQRADAYIEAGADGVMIHSRDKSGNDIKSFCLEFRKKKNPSARCARPYSSLVFGGLFGGLFRNGPRPCAPTALLKTFPPQLSQRRTCTSAAPRARADHGTHSKSCE